MMRAVAAAMAVALLGRLDPAHEPLHGDLLEEFQRGRSLLWLFQQAVVAAGFAVGQRLRGNRRSIASATAVSAAIFGVLAFEAVVTAALAQRVLELTHAPWPALRPGGIDPGLLPTVAVWSAAGVAGAATRRLHRRHRLVAIAAIALIVASSVRFNLSILGPAFGLSAVYAADASSQATSSRASTYSRPSFEVSSVKPNASGGPRDGRLQPGRFAQTNITLRQLIRLASGPADLLSAYPDPSGTNATLPDSQPTLFTGTSRTAWTETGIDESLGRDSRGGSRGAPDTELIPQRSLMRPVPPVTHSRFGAVRFGDPAQPQQ